MHMHSLSLEDTQADEDAEEIQPRNLQPELDKAFLLSTPSKPVKQWQGHPNAFSCRFVCVCMSVLQVKT